MFVLFLKKNKENSVVYKTYILMQGDKIVGPDYIFCEKLNKLNEEYKQELEEELNEYVNHDLKYYCGQNYLING